MDLVCQHPDPPLGLGSYPRLIKGTVVFPHHHRIDASWFSSLSCISSEGRRCPECKKWVFTEEQVGEIIKQAIDYCNLNFEQLLKDKFIDLEEGNNAD